MKTKHSSTFVLHILYLDAALKNKGPDVKNKLLKHTLKYLFDSLLDYLKKRLQGFFGVRCSPDFLRNSEKRHAFMDKIDKCSLNSMAATVCVLCKTRTPPPSSQTLHPLRKKSLTSSSSASQFALLRSLALRIVHVFTTWE